MNRIEFIGNSLFIPFFLISVGMLVNIRVIFHSPRAIIVAIILMVVALSGKWIAAFVIQLFFKYSSLQRQLIFGLSSAHAAATLAVILVGYQAGILNINVFNGTIILILITCLIASFTTERAAKKMALDSEVNGNDALQKISSDERILIPVSNFSEVERLLEFSSHIKNKKSDNPISVLSVVPNNSEAEVNILKYQKNLNSLEKQLSAIEIQMETISTIDHNPASGIVRVSREILSDILVMAWQQKAGFFDKFFGEKIISIVDDLPDKNIFVCRFVKPLINKNKLVFIVPPLTEKNYGFKILVQKIARIAQEYTLPITVFGEDKTISAMKGILSKNDIRLQPNYTVFNDWEDFLILSRNFDKNDLIVLNSVRRDSAAYNPVMEKAPQKLAKHFHHNNLITVYTQQQEISSSRSFMRKSSYGTSF